MDKFIEVHYKRGGKVSSTAHYINSSCIMEFYSQDDRIVGASELKGGLSEVIKSYYLITDRSDHERIEEISEETYNLLLNTLAGKKILNE